MNLLFLVSFFVTHVWKRFDNNMLCYSVGICYVSVLSWALVISVGFKNLVTYLAK